MSRGRIWFILCTRNYALFIWSCTISLPISIPAAMISSLIWESNTLDKLLKTLARQRTFGWQIYSRKQIQTNFTNIICLFAFLWPLPASAHLQENTTQITSKVLCSIMTTHKKSIKKKLYTSTLNAKRPTKYLKWFTATFVRLHKKWIKQSISTMPWEQNIMDSIITRIIILQRKHWDIMFVIAETVVISLVFNNSVIFLDCFLDNGGFVFSK